MKESLSIYTPSNMDQELLEAVFVQREKLLEKSTQWVREGLITKKKNHLLFVGSRGSGKTHLITMIINRLKSDISLEDKMVLAWIGEDDVIMHFLDFTLSILRAIPDSDTLQTSILKSARGMEPNDAATFILDSISKEIGDKTLLVVKENMSDVFSGLKDDGQKRLRAFLQEEKNMVLLTTSQQLFEGVSSRNAAFFGFFDIHHLKPLSIDDAIELIGRIAKLKGDNELHDFVHTSQGRYRVRALHHLAGGNHRLYMDLLEFLTMESLDDLVSALEKLADNLTPYFQERIKSLPPQQGKIVQKLCSIEGALPVKSIAEELFIGERSMAKQLGELLKKNYVLAHKRGKQTYYEIAEPLMRLSLEVKHNHGKPLKMLVLLLRAWFTDKELMGSINETSDALLMKYQNEALTINNNITEALHSKIIDDIMKYNDNNKYDKVIEYSSELLTSPNINAMDKYIALSSRALAYDKVCKVQLSKIDFETVAEMDIEDSLKAPILGSIASIFFDEKDYLGAIQYFSQIVNMENIPQEMKNLALKKRAESYTKIEEKEHAIEDYTLILDSHPTNIEKIDILFERVGLYFENNQFSHAEEDLTDMIGMSDISATELQKALVERSIIYSVLEKDREGIKDLKKALSIDGDYPKEHSYALIANSYYRLGDIAQAHNYLEKGLKNTTSSPVGVDTIVFHLTMKKNIWASEAKYLTNVLKKHKLLEDLGQALMKSIEPFATIDSKRPQLDEWIEIWEQEAGELAFMRTPLKALKVARDALAHGNDKPLFELPKEIRELVLPLIEEKIKTK